MDYLKLLKRVKSDKYLRVILVAISFFPKLIMLDDRPLWIDEAWRANLILNPNFLHRTIFGADEYTAITSPGFALFAKLTTLLTDTSPSHLRLVSLLSGVFLTLLTYEIVRKYDRRLAFTASIYISFGTPILNASLEFKQYLLESVIQALLIFLIVIRIEEKKLHNGILPVATMIGIAFSPTVLFLVPILFIVDFKYNTRKSILISSWLCAALVTVLFFFISWRHATTEEMLDIWGLGFNQESNLNEIVFQFQAILFTLRGFTTLLLPGIPVLIIFYLLFYLLFLFVSSKFHRKNVLSIVALSLISYSTIIFANLLHKWPVGDLRNNLFIKTNCLIIFFLLVSQIKSALARKQISYFLIGIFLTVNFYGFDFNWKRYGPPIERSDLALSFVANDSRFMNQIKKDCLKKKSPMIFTTNGVEDSLNFYNNYNSSTKNDFNQLLNSCVKFIPAMNLKTLRIHFNELSKSKSNAFLIYTHYSKQEQKQVRTLIATYFPSASNYEFDSAGFSTLNSS
jgi:hypothetical protein